MSLQKLLKIAGYDEMLFYFSKNKYANKSSKDLKELIEKYKESETDLLVFDSKKKRQSKSCWAKIIFCYGTLANYERK